MANYLQKVYFLGEHMTENARRYFFWILVTFCCLIIAYYIFLNVRLYFKRLKFVLKLKSVCNDCGYKIYKRNVFSFFNGKKIHKKCDLIIETTTDVFVIKLFGVLKKKKSLRIIDENTYCLRLTDFRNRHSDSIKRKLYIDFDYSKINADISKDKNIRKILLLNPSPRDVLVGDYDNFCDGDRVFDFYFFSSHKFLNKLKKNDFHFEDIDRIYFER